MDNRVTKNRVSIHLEYDWLIYLLIIALVIFATYMVFMQINITRDFERVDVFFACYANSADELDEDFLTDIRSEGDDVIREVNISYNSPTNEYYYTLLTASGFTSDILIIPKADMAQYNFSFVELDDYVLGEIFGDNTALRDSVDYYEYTPSDDAGEEVKAYAGHKYGIRVDNLKKINSSIVENSEFIFDLSKYSDSYTEEELAEHDTEFYIVINKTSTKIGEKTKKEKYRDLTQSYRFVGWFVERYAQ